MSHFRNEKQQNKPLMNSKFLQWIAKIFRTPLLVSEKSAFFIRKIYSKNNNIYNLKRRKTRSAITVINIINFTCNENQFQTLCLAPKNSTLFNFIKLSKNKKYITSQKTYKQYIRNPEFPGTKMKTHRPITKLPHCRIAELSNCLIVKLSNCHIA